MQHKLSPKLSKWLIGLSTTLILAQASASSIETFEQCQQRFSNLADNKGLSPKIQQVIKTLAPVERVISLDKNQPEFAQSFAQYVDKRVSQYHIKHGRIMLKKHENLLSSLQEKYGVAPQYLVSFWGLETVFGRHKGKMSVLNSIATLACDKRRKRYFTSELFDLFHLIDQDTVKVEQLSGSWAGAMGHMQFMPSAFKKYAIDGDGDGKIDVWQSEVDALTSAANYLNKIGWEPSIRWGREVRLPENFDFSAFEFDTRYALKKFANAGVKQINGKMLPVADIQAELVLPNGYQGNAFLVYRNFDVIMKWNLSKNYALSVGILADKLVGSQGVQPIKDPKPLHFSRHQMEQLQATLNEMGFESGKPDGIWGPNSRKAIRAFQLKHSLVADGFPNPEVFSQLQLNKDS
ncbi:lytic murein transglycosylase [Thalassotalea sp. 1_MG-2023]|uniref:lytic murein transglycosylase n=1 Tax=Thalassotalea sp. 1_MG-2023 TaxID=3062680 RepID=UPI0026E28D94|nr:lytic murein transglycosylase [Thalassotalea sp. 1_MG-2023]MDO6427311.1 lytic murein transglycosylase [Thalassotalea sp. 1_MG-2023]